MSRNEKLSESRNPFYKYRGHNDQNRNPYAHKAHNPNHPPHFLRPQRSLYGTVNSVFGFKRVYEFLSKTPAQVITYIDEDAEAWEGFLNSEDLDSKFLILVVQVIAQKVCDKDVILMQKQLNVLSKSLGEKFRSRLVEKCNLNFKIQEMAEANNSMFVDPCQLNFFTCLYTFYSFVAEKLPSTANDFILDLITPVISAMSIMEPEFVNSTKKSLFDSTFADFKTLILDLTTKIAKAKEKVNLPTKGRFYGFTEDEEKTLHEFQPPDNFRQIPNIPPLKELLSSELTFLRTNKKEGAYTDSNHYLDVQYRLLREDFVKPLKDGIQEFKRNKHGFLTGKVKMRNGNIRLYPGVRILKPELLHENLMFNIQLPENKYKGVKWDRVKRLMNGSLLVFTMDDFDTTVFFASVLKRDETQLSEKGIFGVIWERQIPPNYYNQKFLMIECQVYFEAYRYTLEILQKIQLDTFPLSKFIVEGSAEVEPPGYLNQNVHLMDVGKTKKIFVSPLALDTWPQHTQIGLDINQFKAFQAALTKEISIIQGPPGTGKTHLGLHIAEVLLKNSKILNVDKAAPIFVVCYTNHALDQFLEGIIKSYEIIFPGEYPKIVRVGGRSNNENVNKFNISKCHMNHAYLSDSFMIKYAKNKVQRYEEKRAINIIELNALIQPYGIIL